jgi:hypothetical protein
MQGWQTPYLGLRELPREFTEFELQAFFSFSRSRAGADRTPPAGDNHKLGLALHIGFVRMSGRPLNSVRAVPVALLRHLGQMLDIATPDLASLRALYAWPHPVRSPAAGLRGAGLCLDERAPAPRVGASPAR